MSFWKKLDPTGGNFLGLGPKVGRIVADVTSGGGPELNRPDPFGLNRNTAMAKGLGGASTGAATGAGTGAMVGGPWGAVAGGILGGLGGGIAGATGATKNYNPMGFLKNVGIGVGGGLLGGGGAALAGSGAGASGAGAGGMSAYMPTSTPVMGQAGSTLGGGMGSSMNLAPAYGSQTGAVATGMPTASAATPSTAAKLLQGMRGMPSGGGSQGTSPASKQANMLQMIYQMMPGLKPGSNNMGQMNVGGF